MIAVEMREQHRVEHDRQRAAATMRMHTPRPASTRIVRPPRAPAWPRRRVAVGKRVPGSEQHHVDRHGEPAGGTLRDELTRSRAAPRRTSRRSRPGAETGEHPAECRAAPHERDVPERRQPRHRDQEQLDHERGQVGARLIADLDREEVPHPVAINTVNAATRSAGTGTPPRDAVSIPPSLRTTGTTPASAICPPTQIVAARMCRNSRIVSACTGSTPRRLGPLLDASRGLSQDRLPTGRCDPDDAAPDIHDPRRPESAGRVPNHCVRWYLFPLWRSQTVTARNLEPTEFRDRRPNASFAKQETQLDAGGLETYRRRLLNRTRQSSTTVITPKGMTS